ncbi:antibiotic biosynthesis monooxygenase [Lolliginicoccus suaedae]|uniref:antibiotic biosynthesis monooxygenase n=1 Tax=Lolliginicoccus suaedae TaxID=2605429 RepID=UPI0011ED4834
MQGLPAPTVTTSVIRDVDPGREEDFVQWTEAGIALARTFPGFLGAGWVRSSTTTRRYHVQYRFASDGCLRDWMRSSLRSAWLAHGRSFSRDAAVHQRTGIEGWFDPAVPTSMQGAVPVDPRPASDQAPPRWKQAVTIWLGFFPLSLLVNILLAPQLADVNVVASTLLLTVCVTPVMVYAVLPFITARLGSWLRARRD